MDLQRRFVIEDSVEHLWRILNHPPALAAAVPGLRIESTEGAEFTGSINIKLGALTLVYTGTGRYLQRSTGARQLIWAAKGRDHRGHGTASVELTVSLREQDRRTCLELSGPVTLTGKPAQFGPQVITEAGDRLIEQFASRVVSQSAPEAPAHDIPEAPAVPPLDAETVRRAAPAMARSAVLGLGTGASAAAIAVLLSARRRRRRLSSR